MSNNIITYAKNNINIGELVVKDNNALKEIRDSLLTATGYNNYGIHRISFMENLGGDYSVLNEGFFRSKDTLIRQYATDFGDDDYCEYTRKVFECKCLNLIRLLNSLLGEINPNNYESRIVKEFIKLGIVDVVSFEQNWKLLFNNMIEAVYREIDTKNVSDLNKLHMYEFKLFRFMLEEGIISYDINDCVCFKSYKGKPFLKGNEVNFEELDVNNALLLGDDKIFKKYAKSLKK